MILTLPKAHERRAMIERANEASAHFGVSKEQVRIPEKFSLNAEQLENLRQENKQLLDAISQQMIIVHELLVESCYAMSIADCAGYILDVYGHKSMLAYYATRNCVPGYQWTLKTAGTSSMAIALKEQRPIVLGSTETWPHVSRDYVNAATPVFDHHDALIGVMSMTGLKESMQSHTIGLLVQAAANVQLQFREAQKIHEAQVRNHFLDSLIEVDVRGVVALDTDGAILRMNKKACALLGVQAGYGEDAPLYGLNIDTLLRSEFKLTPLVMSGMPLAERETLCLIKNTSADTSCRYILSLTPIGSGHAQTLGALLHMTERQHMINIVNAVSGLHPTYTFESLVGESPAFQEAVRLAQIVSQSDAPVLIQGETGTGKELFAQAIHNASTRAKGVFMAINCGAIPRDLLESELFGYEAGAFTGAQKGGRPGKLELSHGGTLFLDEIGDMPFDMQVKLLRVLNSGEIQRIGGRKSIVLNLRIITATHVDLYESVANKSFREDLYYRINTFHVHVPPLRTRSGDIMLLAHFFLQHLQGHVTEKVSFSPQAALFMENYPWPGNVREMQSAVERGLRLCSGKCIEPEHLFGTTRHTSVKAHTSITAHSSMDKSPLTMPIKSELAESQSREPAFGIPQKIHSEEAYTIAPVTTSRKERELAEIVYYMKLYDNNVSKVARALQVSRVTVYRKLKQLAPL